MLGKCAAALVVMLLVMLPGVNFLAAEEFGAMITKVDGENVTFYKTPTKPGEKPQKGDELTLTAKDAKVFEGKIQPNQQKNGVEIVPGDAIDGGLKNEVFNLIGKATIAARITTAADNKSITRILSLKPGKKKPAEK